MEPSSLTPQVCNQPALMVVNSPDGGAGVALAGSSVAGGSAVGVGNDVAVGFASGGVGVSVMGCVETGVAVSVELGGIRSGDDELGSFEQPVRSMPDSSTRATTQSGNGFGEAYSL